jgi:hypothetical protein
MSQAAQQCVPGDHPPLINVDLYVRHQGDVVVGCTQVVPRYRYRHKF